MFNRDIEQGTMDYCAQNGIGIISYSPLYSGLITDGISRERIKNLAGDDFRPRLPDFQEPLLSIHLKAIERLKPIAKRSGLTLPQLAISWVLRQGDLTSAIVGARCVGHIDEIVKAGELVMAEEGLFEIESILTDHQAESKEVLIPHCTVPPIHAALVKRLGRDIPMSTTYRLLARHNWRKVQPDTKHPKSDPALQDEFKKNFPKRWQPPV